MPHKAEKHNPSPYLKILQDLGIRLTGNLQQLAKNAEAKAYDVGTFMFYLRKTKEYRQEFTGIFRKDGTMKMSETQYISNRNQFESVASRAGINLGPKMMDWLFLNNVSPSEFSDRAAAITQLKRNKDLYRAFRQELLQAGQKPGQVTRKNLLKFVLGRGNPQWYDLWNDAVVRNAAQQSGLAVGRRKAVEFLPQGALERISGLGLSPTALNRGFEQLADDITNLIPDSQLFRAGLTVDDLVTLRFGGKNRQAIKEKVDRIMAERNLSAEEKVAPQMIQTQKGSSVNYGGLAGETGY